MLVELELELIDAIRRSPIAASLRQVAALPDSAGDALINIFATTAPAVYAVIGGTKFINGLASVRFSLMCLSKNSRGHDAARRGDGQTIGLYQMLDGLSAWLDSHQTDSTVWNVNSIDFATAPIWRDNGLSVATIQLTDDVLQPALLDESTLADFITFNADYDVDPHQAQTEHLKWAQEPPDYTTSRPELTDITTIP